MLIPAIPVNAMDLWGNLAGDDEDIDVLDQYFVGKAELFGAFRNPGVPLRIIRSRKGMGESALLRKVAHERRSGHRGKAASVNNIYIWLASGVSYVSDGSLHTQ